MKSALKKVEIGAATLYLGDCVQALLAGEFQAGAVITDPPYEIDAHTPMRRTRASIDAGVDSALNFNPITDQERLALAAYSAKNCAGWLIAFCQVEAVAAWRAAVTDAGAKYRRAMVWTKPDSSPQFNGQGPAQGYESIMAAWCGTGNSRWNGGGRRGVFDYLSTHGRYGGHPTEKPLGLMSELVNLFSDPGSTVFDPFMGSGTTGVACLRAGRRFVGIEKDPTYFEIACKRLRAAAAQPDMFIRSAPPKQEPLL